jgi:AbrB family looped-hinge helix DNA binding protein
MGKEGNKMLLHVDSRKRITIPKDANLRPGDTVELEILPDGRLILVPVATIPKHQPSVTGGSQGSLRIPEGPPPVDRCRVEGGSGIPVQAVGQ